jgi:hypothetical protein
LQNSRAPTHRCRRRTLEFRFFLLSMWFTATARSSRPPLRRHAAGTLRPSSARPASQPLRLLPLECAGSSLLWWKSRVTRAGAHCGRCRRGPLPRIGDGPGARARLSGNGLQCTGEGSCRCQALGGKGEEGLSIVSVNLCAVVASVLTFVPALWYPNRMMRAVGQALEE